MIIILIIILIKIIIMEERAVSYNHVSNHETIPIRLKLKTFSELM